MNKAEKNLPVGNLHSTITTKYEYYIDIWVLSVWHLFGNQPFSTPILIIFLVLDPTNISLL